MKDTLMRLKDAAEFAESRSDGIVRVTLTSSVVGVTIEATTRGFVHRHVVTWAELDACRVNPLVYAIDHCTRVVCAPEDSRNRT